MSFPVGTLMFTFSACLASVSYCSSTSLTLTFVSSFLINSCCFCAKEPRKAKTSRYKGVTYHVSIPMPPKNKLTPIANLIINPSIF
ncbi:hypothetical protein A2W60_02760 [Candidatus Azambacteria bacterium RIFCSPHIGHO2_02_46_12]|uniref:Secreted protein n=1 Tax=Candidatus Azambacteria bacterium RIFCSPHIGHO2_02_46_12 TaxID=1797295 RepID=A0A1F5BJ22_9BACT|nr:MAG: hypothetical protein A2W60_02760 [Candidatus Azambacteria bacterium RIFCSPHIGHO2_02_46_12]